MKQPAQKRSKAQQAASQKWAAAGRAREAAARAKYRAAHHGMAPPRSKAQQAATKKWQRGSVAAAAARRAGKKPVKAKPRAAFAPPGFLPDQRGLPGWLNCNDLYPVCAATAAANHLLVATGIRMTDTDIMQLHRLAGGTERGVSIGDVLQLLGEGSPYLFRWPPLVSFWRAEPDPGIPGLVTGISLPHGEHAVLSHPDGMVSWGSVIPWMGYAEEAWVLDWETGLGFSRDLALVPALHRFG